MTDILGISAFYHDSAACLVATARSSRPRRKSASRARSTTPASRCSAVELLPARRRHRASTDLDYVGFYDKPLLKFERLLETYLAFAPRGFGRS